VALIAVQLSLTTARLTLHNNSIVQFEVLIQISLYEVVKLK